MTEHQTVLPCCDSWAKAQEDGTDHEGYGPALVTSTTLPPDYELITCLLLSEGLPDTKFCPWCGSPKEFEREKL